MVMYLDIAVMPLFTHFLHLYGIIPLKECRLARLMAGLRALLFGDCALGVILSVNLVIQMQPRYFMTTSVVLECFGFFTVLVLPTVTSSLDFMQLK